MDIEQQMQDEIDSLSRQLDMERKRNKVNWIYRKHENYYQALQIIHLEQTSNGFNIIVA